MRYKECGRRINGLPDHLVESYDNHMTRWGTTEGKKVGEFLTVFKEGKKSNGKTSIMGELKRTEDDVVRRASVRLIKRVKPGAVLSQPERIKLDEAVKKLYLLELNMRVSDYVVQRDTSPQTAGEDNSLGRPLRVPG